jgi:TonB family protein
MKINHLGTVRPSTLAPMSKGLVSFLLPLLWVGASNAAENGGLFCPVMRRLSACVCACLLLQPTHATELAQPAKILEASAPEYPSAARRRDDQGTVHVRVRVLASGQASEVQVQRSSGIPELDQAAVAAVNASKFRPAQSVAGVPVDSWVIVPYKFILQD